MARTMSKSEKREAEMKRAAREAAKEQRRNELRGQIWNLDNEITIYSNQISSLESKLADQRKMKTAFDTKCAELDIEKAAKSVSMEPVALYVGNQKFALGCTEVMTDFLHGNTAQTYQNYGTEIRQFMELEINENQEKLEELISARHSRAMAVADLNNQLARV